MATRSWDNGWCTSANTRSIHGCLDMLKCEGSPVSPILFTIYLSCLFGYVEDKVPGIKALSFVDDVAWQAEGKVRTPSAPDWKRRRKRRRKQPRSGPAKCGNLRHEATALSRRRRTVLADARGIMVGKTQSTSINRRPGG